MPARPLAALALVSLLGVTAACSSGPPGSATPVTTTPVMTTSRAAAPASSSSGTPSSASPIGAPSAASVGASFGDPGQSAVTTQEPVVVEPPTPTAPAATRAGSLDQRALPSPSGWSTAAGDGADGGYIPNGTWVNARDPRSTVHELLGLACQGVPAGYPVPVAALEGTYRGPGGASGATVALELADEGSARRLVELYRLQAESCRGRGDAPFTYALLRAGPDLVDRRTFAGESGTWLEVVGVRGRRAIFLLLQEGAGPLTPRQVDGVVAALR